MKYIGIIPSRYESSRFPGKPLIDLKGKSMIKRVYERVKSAALFDKIVVATDDDRIFRHVKEFGGNVEMTSANHKTGTERCGEVVKKLNLDKPDTIIVNIQGDEPLVEKKQLELLLSAFKNKMVDIATLGSKNFNNESPDNPNRVKVVLNHNNNALYFSRSPIPYRQKINNSDFIRHIGIYAFRAPILNKVVSLASCEIEKAESLEQLRWLYYGFTIQVLLTNIESPNIDVPQDVEKVLKLL